MVQKSKNHLDLLFSVSKLSNLIRESSDIENFLHRTAALVSEHLEVPVCSIYLYEEETGDLVLRATKGLRPEAVNRVRMRIGTGLVGATLGHMAPICEGDAPRNPRFKYFSVAGEDPFRSFLSVPIARGTLRIGVLVVQHEARNYFDETDLQTLRTLASQAAGVIGSVRVLMGADTSGSKTHSRLPLSPLVKGTPAAPGLAYGPAMVFTESHVRRLDKTASGAAGCTLTDFKRAVRTTADQLAALQQHLIERLPEGEALIFEAHLLILKDPRFKGGVAEQVGAGRSVPEAVRAVARQYMVRFESSPDPYLREKAEDIADLAGRVLENLSTGGASAPPYMNGKVVVSRTLYPSEVLRFAVEEVAGIVLVTGTVASHAAILARSLKIPTLIADHPELLELPEETPLLIDADLGNLYLRPSETVLRRFKERVHLQELLETRCDPLPERCRTFDGSDVALLANINLLGELAAARQLNAGGVGLYRTEFPFLARSGIPSEEEQVRVYRYLCENMDGKPITIRTLDVGGDKVMPGRKSLGEPNPELGLRSIRFSLAHPDLFVRQLRAILQAGAGCPSFRIAFPMVGSLDEFEAACRCVRDCIDALSKEGIDHHPSPALGAMVEVPSAVEVIEVLAEQADFLSIGTNDLVQYVLAVDRTSEKMAGWYRAGHPAVLRVLKRIADAGRKAGTPVSICGEIAHDPAFIPFLIGIGVRALSVDPAHLSSVYRCVAGVKVSQAEEFAQRLLQETTLSGVEALLLDKERARDAKDIRIGTKPTPKSFPPSAFDRRT